MSDVLKWRARNEGRERAVTMGACCYIESEGEARKVDYTVMIIRAYAKEKGLGVKEAFFQLRDCGGIEALDEFYDVEHTLPVSSTLDGLTALHARSAS